MPTKKTQEEIDLIKIVNKSFKLLPFHPDRAKLIELACYAYGLGAESAEVQTITCCDNSTKGTMIFMESKQIKSIIDDSLNLKPDNETKNS